ncbi:alpha/beta fold hydrolase [Pseudonocardia sp. RS11V-5]|uniref:alpha/beta fold hydrolase n=1 Tax=Pseudonocardia terrae TaxID=2905831 RepID=UPI001E5FE0E4|nr:alpha/beta fold hydrolase [Pseudonocardia terrae]MCE3555264.1 alpha/beta fold hydrolase [Pseudonocardia terrae]
MLRALRDELGSRLGAAAANAWDRTVAGGVADLRRMPRTEIAREPGGTLHRYDPLPGVPLSGPAVVLIPPLGAPDFAYDLRRDCSLVEHLLGTGRPVYLVDYGPIAFGHRRLGIEHWVDDVVPRAVRGVAGVTDGPVHLVGWSLGGLFCLLALAAAEEAGEPLPVRAVAAIGSPVDVTAVPLVAPLRPLAEVAGGRAVSALYRAVGSWPAPLVSTVFQLTTVDKMITRPLAILSRLDDRDTLAQIEAVDHMMANMHGYPGRVFGQLFHLFLRSNDLAGGSLELAGRRVSLASVKVPALVVGGRDDVIAPLRAVRRAVDLLSGAPEVRFESAPGGHLGVLTGRRARTTTWAALDAFLAEH